MAFDTTDEAAEIQRDIWRRLGPAGRVELAFDMSDAMRRITLAGIAASHPELDERGRMVEYIRRVHGVDVEAEE